MSYWRVSFKTQTPVGNTYLQYRLYPHCINHSTFAIDYNQPGSSTFTRPQLYLNVDDNTLDDLPPIYTESAAVTRDADEISYDSANHSDTAGTWLIEVEATGAANILDGFLSHTGTEIELDDGTNTQASTEDFSSHKIGIVYGDSTMRLNVDGVWQAEGPYDGTLLSGILDLARASTVVEYFGEILRYDVKSEAIVDEWMAS